MPAISRHKDLAATGHTCTFVAPVISDKRKGVHVGSKNGNAKQFLLISPKGVKHTADGNLKQLCASLNLSHATIRASYELNRPMRSGWQVKRLNAK